MQRFDALIIGGGPAGATAAILLADAGWSVALIEQKQFPRRKVCGEYLSATNWPLLTRLGVAEQFTEMAGPPVCETAIFVGEKQYRAPLPRSHTGKEWGRALGREHLDTLLLERAAKWGVAVMQPARCIELRRAKDGDVATIENGETGQSCEVTSSVIIAAHGSWDIGTLPTQRKQASPRASDWLAFKAHFCETSLPLGLMPLLCFDGGYGGMVHVGGGRASLSCCIQRRVFAHLSRAADVPAGESVLTHILESCPVLGEVLADAVRDGVWLSAGVIQPGIKPRCREGAFVVGNAAGEAHPVVAEGISMAMQSAWLLAERLIPHRSGLQQQSIRDWIGRSYSAAWRRAFAPRIYAAAAIAQWASRPRLVHWNGPLLAAFPAFITLGAKLAGKSHVVLNDKVRPAAAQECFQV